MSSAGRKLAVVMGVANPRSIAWEAVQSLTDHGFDCIATYQSERFRKNLDDLAAANPRVIATLPCDVEKQELPKLFNELIPESLESKAESRQIDTILHSIAYANFEKTTLGQASLEAYLQAQHISAYSLLETARCAKPLLSPESASLTALSYLGAVRAVEGYHIMGPAKASLEALVRGLAVECGASGLRVNAVSAGPLKTLAARGIPGFSNLWQQSADLSPLGKHVTTRQVADTVSFLATKGSGITGQVIYVDGGFSSTVTI